MFSLGFYGCFIWRLFEGVLVRISYAGCLPREGVLR